MSRIIVVVLFLITFIPEYTFDDYSGGRIYQKTTLFKSDFIFSFSRNDLILISFLLFSFLLKRKENEQIVLKLPKKVRTFFIFSILILLLSVAHSLWKGNPNPLFFLKPFVYILVVYITIQNLRLSRVEIQTLEKFFTFFIFLYSFFVMAWVIMGRKFELGQLYFVPWSILLLFASSNLLKIAKRRGNLIDYLSAFLNIGVIVVGQIRSIWLSLLVVIVGIFLLRERIFVDRNRMKKTYSYTSRKFLIGFLVAGCLLIINLWESLVFRRILSMKIFGEISPEAIGYQDNADHLSDFREGINAIRSNWLFGSGLGAGWETPMSSYRVIAFGFHNSLTTVWFWCGIFGAFLWILFPFVFTMLIKELQLGQYQSSIVSFFEASALKIWIFAIYLPTLAFQAWSFTSQSFGIFFGLLLSLLVHRYRGKSIALEP